MKLHSSHTNEVSLARFGDEASAMLLNHDFVTLANRFGYALAFDRNPAAAIEADFLNAVASPHRMDAGACRSTIVKFFAPNETGLVAVVECVIPIADNAAIFLALAVTGDGDEKNIAVEDITGVAA